MDPPSIPGEPGSANDPVLKFLLHDQEFPALPVTAKDRFGCVATFRPEDSRLFPKALYFCEIVLSEFPDDHEILGFDHIHLTGFIPDYPDGFTPFDKAIFGFGIIELILDHYLARRS